MKLVTRYDLAKLSLTELKGLYHQTFNILVQSERGTHQRCNALANLETITYAIALRSS